MFRYENLGTTIEVKLPNQDGYQGFSAVCRYIFDHEVEKYRLSMWLHHEEIDDLFKIDEQEIDTQYITSEKKDIKKNICRIVEQAYSCGFFDDYIRRFEYTYNCFNRGNEMIEQEVESQEALASVS